MKDAKLLYQIKSLEKMILRSLPSNQVSDLEKDFVCPTPTQMQIMEYIIEHQTEDVYQKDLEDVLKLRRATVSGVLKTMEKNNLIERVTSINDTRTKKIILNRKAKNIFLKREEKINEIEKIVIKDISKEDLCIFSKVIDMMKNNLEKSM